eukprot:XP_014786076.1 PREDICTED: extensin-like [Octopus bimaculoides]
MNEPETNRILKRTSVKYDHIYSQVNLLTKRVTMSCYPTPYCPPEPSCGPVPSCYPEPYCPSVVVPCPSEPVYPPAPTYPPQPFYPPQPSCPAEPFVPPVPSCNPMINAGDRVTISADIETLMRYQVGHGGWDCHMSGITES